MERLARIINKNGLTISQMQKTGRKILAILVVAAAALFVTAPIGQAVTMQDLLDGESITFGGKLFDGFTNYGSTGTSNQVPYDALDITVTTVTVSGEHGLVFTFNPDLTAPGQSTHNLFFEFNVTCLSCLLSDATLSFIDGVTGESHASLTITETVRDNLNNVIATITVHEDNTSTTTPSHMTFSPQASVRIEKLIHLEGPNELDQGGHATLESVTQTFSQVPASYVPEPASLLLLGSGLSLLGVVARTRRR